MSALTDAAEGPTADQKPVLQVHSVCKAFTVGRGFLGIHRDIVRAVDSVSLSVSGGETLGIVGESGSGKSTLAQLIVGLQKPTSGSIQIGGDGSTQSSSPSRTDVQMVFQDPASSLNPKLKVGRSIAEPVMRTMKRVDREHRVRELLQLVGLRAEIADRYPEQLSGGQQQRVCIARALINNPRLVIHDEAVSALDVSVQAQVLNLLADLQDQLGLTYVFISHDLAVVRMISTRIAVMYLGQVVENMPAPELSKNLLHPYSVALRSAVPLPNPETERTRQRIVLAGDIPSPMDPPSGCRFHTRCPLARDRCRVEQPLLIEHRPGHWAACHYAGKFDREMRILEPLTSTASKVEP